jgi:hypothetical protein
VRGRRGPGERLFYTTGVYKLDGRFDAIERLHGAVREFVDRGPQALTAPDLGEQLVRLRHAIDLLELGFAADAAVFAGTNEYEVQGSTSPIDWLRHFCHMSGHAAARAVAAGEQSPGLPETVAALEAGRIGFGHFSLLSGVARALRKQFSGSGDPEDGDGADANGIDAPPVTEDPDAEATADAVALALGASGFDERPLLALALEHSVGRFSFDCIHARHAGDAAAVLAEHVQGVERRRLELIPCEGGGVAVRGLFENVAGATIRTVLEKLPSPPGLVTPGIAPGGSPTPSTRPASTPSMPRRSPVSQLLPISSSPPRWRR